MRRRDLQKEKEEIFSDGSVDSAPSRSFFTSFLIALHLVIALPLAYFLNIWMDEASTLYTTEKGFVQTFQNVFADEKQAPLYFLILSLWRIASGSIFWARLFSILCSALAIKFFVSTAQKFFDRSEARFISVLFALSPFLIQTSIEIRGYSLTILLSVLLLKFFAEGYLNFQKDEAEARKKQRIFFLLTAVVALYTNYYLGFALVGFFLVLIVTGKHTEAKKYFLQMLSVLLAITPLLWIVKQQLAVNTSGFQEERTLLTGMRHLWNHALTMLFPTEFYAPATQTSVSFFRLWLVRFGILMLVLLAGKHVFKIAKIFFENRRCGDGRFNFRLYESDPKFLRFVQPVLIFGVTAATVGAFLLVAYFLLGSIYVELRHMAVWFVPLVLFVFSLLAMLLPRRSWIFFVVLMAFFYSYSFYRSYAPMAKRGDWIRVARYIEANEKPNQPIIVFQNYDALSLPYHYRGVNKILPDKNFFAWSFEADPASEGAFRKQIEFVIGEIPPDAEEIWLATEETCHHEKTRKACQPLENYIEANYTIEKERDFYLEKVRLLRKKSR
jgi:Predicted membrane protein